ncbi:MAG: manganese-dependent inorganic pyrophosphatase, partial [Gemmobacter sp.]|nr:manganese-dependent inorganic pyrophosphatase [Gemmobacter sp.]
KEYNVAGRELRVSVLETTAPGVLLDRKDGLMAAMPEVARQDGADQVLLFIVDILNEEATLLVPNDLVKQMAEASFGVAVSGDTVLLPGIMSRKKQIIPSLKL